MTHPLGRTKAESKTLVAITRFALWFQFQDRIFTGPEVAEIPNRRLARLRTDEGRNPSARNGEAMMNRPDTVSQNLRCPLTDPEKIRLGEGLARLLEEMGEVEDEQKATATKFKAQLEGIDSAVTKTRKILSAGYEYRWIDCRVLYHKPATRQKTIVRLDTGEEVRIEDMNEDECQENLPLRPITDLPQVDKSPQAAEGMLPLTPQNVVDAIAERLPEINAELQANAPPGTTVTLGIDPDAPAPVVEAPIAAAAAEAVHHGSNGKRKRTAAKNDPPQTMGAGVYPA